VRKVARLDGKREGQMFDCILMDLEMPGESRHEILCMTS
jgi:CheY-like chemotaxis protein